MGVTYNTIEDRAGYSFPAWNTTWPAYDGCSTRYVVHSATSGMPPTGQQSVYEPYISVKTRNPNPRSGKRPGFPPYKVTPHVVSEITTRNYLLKRNNGSNGINRWWQYGIVSKVAGNCTPQVTDAPSSGPIGPTWTDVTHSFTGTDYVINGFDQNELDNAYLSVQNEASLAALTSYDVLTDAAELREIPQLVRSVSQTISGIARTLRGRYDPNLLRRTMHLPILNLLKHPNRTINRLGKEWMQYRYGIMPLVYSYRDILKTASRHQVYTVKKSKSVSPKRNSTVLPGSTTDYKWSQFVGNVTIRATVYQVYDSEEASRWNALGVNPLVTAWELIPFSFVFDWFINMGDYITRKTSAIRSKICWATVSRRDNYTKETYVHYKQDHKTVTFSNNMCSPWWGNAPPANPSGQIQRPEGSQLLKEVVTNSYNRQIFAISDAQLSVKPSLNWRRLLDSAAMSISQLNALCKRF